MPLIKPVTEQIGYKSMWRSTFKLVYVVKRFIEKKT